jgi:hypothetical protein
MKGIIFLLISLVFCFGSYGQKKAQSYVVYNESPLYSFSYPANWNKQPLEGAEFCFIRPKENASQKFRENINLVIDPPDDLTLQEYGEVAINKMSSQMNSFRLFSSGIVKINQRNFYKIVYQFKFKKLMMKDIYFITVENNRSYNFTCSALPSTFSQFQPVFEKIIQSFSLVSGKQKK